MIENEVRKKFFGTILISLLLIFYKILNFTIKDFNLIIVGNILDM